MVFMCFDQGPPDMDETLILAAFGTAPVSNAQPGQMPAWEHLK
jgi:hypothetical protein